MPTFGRKPTRILPAKAKRIALRLQQQLKANHATAGEQRPPKALALKSTATGQGAVIFHAAHVLKANQS